MKIDQKKRKICESKLRKKKAQKERRKERKINNSNESNAFLKPRVISVAYIVSICESAITNLEECINERSSQLCTQFKQSRKESVL